MDQRFHGEELVRSGDKCQGHQPAVLGRGDACGHTVAARARVKSNGSAGSEDLGMAGRERMRRYIAVTDVDEGMRVGWRRPIKEFVINELCGC